jgi:LPXTG-motif cell wall-anchored protein
MRAAVIVAAVFGLLGGSLLVAAPAWGVVVTPQPPITVGGNPVGVTFNPAGTKGYVAISSTNQVVVVDRATGNLLAPISTCSGPMGIAFTPDGTKAFVPCDSPAGTVSVIDPATGATLKSIAVGTAPFFIAMSPDGTRAYVPNSGGPAGTVSVIDTATETVTATIPVGLAPVAVAFNAAGTKAYVANSAVSGGNSVSVIDVATSTVTATIALAGVPYGVAVSPLDGSIYVSRDNGLKVSIINPSTNLVTTTFATAGKPEGVTFSPDGSRAYVPMQTGGVAVFDTATATELAPIPTGVGSRILAFTPDGTLAYVTNNLDGTISVIAFDNTLPTIAGVASTDAPLDAFFTFTPTITAIPGYTVTSTALPAGLALDPASGIISGTPTAPVGPTVVTLTVTDANGTATHDVTITVTQVIAQALPATGGTTAGWLVPWGLGSIAVGFGLFLARRARGARP